MLAEEGAQEETVVAYLDGIVNTVLVKDVLARNPRGNASLVRGLAEFLVDTSGSLVSVKKIADTLTSAGLKTTSDTVVGYLDSLTSAFLFYQCSRFDVVGRKYLAHPVKYYPVDPGLRRSLIGTKRVDRGHRLEQVVYMELIRRGYAVFVGAAHGSEVDFVATRDGVTTYVQVTQLLSDAAVYNREIAPLAAITDNYRKIILTEEPGSSNDNGIEIINVADWLIEAGEPMR